MREQKYVVRYMVGDRPWSFTVWAFNKLDASAIGRMKFEAAVPAEQRVGVLCYGAERAS